MAEHTPAPWQVTGKTGTNLNGLAIMGAPSEDHPWGEIVAIVVEVRGRPISDRTRADAALIAAAPGLLAACECEEAIWRYEIPTNVGGWDRTRVEKVLMGHGWDDDGCESWRMFARRLRQEAIAEARRTAGGSEEAS